MKTIKYALGCFLIAGAAMAANIALRSGPVDVADLRSIVNQMVLDVNVGVAGLLNVNGTTVANSGTAEATLYSYTMPANYLAVNGQSIRVRCTATTANNGNNKTLLLYFGSQSITSAAAANTTGGFLEYVVTRTGAATQTLEGYGQWGATGIIPTAIQHVAGTQDLTTALDLRCRATDAVSTDTTGRLFVVETIR